MIKGRSWCWTAVGKHPAAADYIRLGGSSSLMDAVADWAAKGYNELLRINGRPQGSHSWRFWLRGVKKGGLICGLGLDSSDRIGRPYPLMIVGEGTQKGWEKNWTTLPDQLNRTWKQLEYIASRRYEDAGAMEEEILGLPPPLTESANHAVSGGPKDAQIDVESKVHQCRRQLQSAGIGLMSLQSLGSTDADQAILQYHQHLVDCCHDIPRGVFIGGTPQQTHICVIDHPLATTDFIQLWTTQ